MKTLAFALALALAGALPVQAQVVRAAASAAALSPVRGEVIEVDAKERRVLVKHGPIRNLGMDAMTMEFLVPEGEPLPPLKPHDRIRFAAAWRGGDYLMTRIELVKPRPRHR